MTSRARQLLTAPGFVESLVALAAIGFALLRGYGMLKIGMLSDTEAFFLLAVAGIIVGAKRWSRAKNRVVAALLVAATIGCAAYAYEAWLR